MSVIDAGNGSIDNPSRAARYRYRKFFGTNDIPLPVAGMLGVDARGHRRFNHDVVGGYLAAMEVSPKYAGDILISHIIMDKLSDNIRNTAGSDKRDLLQALMNINYVDRKRRNQKIRF